MTFVLVRRSGSDKEEYSTLSRPLANSRYPPTSHSYSGYAPSVTPTIGRSVYDYSSDIDIKSSTTFEPGKVSRTPSIPLVHMTGVRRQSTRSSRSGSFSSIDPNETAYANMPENGEPKKFDDPVYAYIKGEEEDFANNPLYDARKSSL